MSAEEVIGIVASAEYGSEHPIAEAVQSEAKRLGVELKRPTFFEALPALGIRAVVDSTSVMIGNERVLVLEGIKANDTMRARASDLEQQGRTVLWLVLGGQVQALIAVADQVREKSPEAVALLKELNVKIVMLTGDNGRVARAVSSKLGIDEYAAEVEPAEKSRVVVKFKATGGVVAMAGDGINDAPALAAADIGIAMGGGTDVARETGGIVLMNDDPRGIAAAIDASRLMSRKIRENLFWAFVYNVLLIPVAAGVLYPFTGWLMSPVLSAFAMGMSSITVTLNSLSLRSYRPPWAHST